MKTINIFILSSIIFIFSACSLDEKIYDTVVVENSIQSEEDVAMLENGILQQLNIAYKQMSLYIESGSDYTACTASAVLAFSMRMIGNGNGYISYTWRGHYMALANANSLLSALEKADFLDAGYKTRVKGEICFLRALCNYNLVRLFGALPLRLEPTTALNLYLSRSSVSDVYAAIFEDLKIASESCLLFSQQDNIDFGRPTKGAAQALLAHASLTYANYCDLNNLSSSSAEYYRQSANYADSVILSNEYGLVDDFSSLWNVEKETKAGSYKEVIFGIQFARDALATGVGSLGSGMASFFQPSSRYFVCGNGTNKSGYNSAQIQPWFYDQCTSGDYVNDYRSEVSFTTSWAFKNTSTKAIVYPAVKVGTEAVTASAPYCPYLNKYVDSEGYDANNNENDFYVIRMSEVYLIKAEAENELNGPTAIAYEAFNKVRERARKANGVARTTPKDLQSGLSKEDFRMKVYDERGIEFVGELKRIFDNVRMRYIDNVRPMVQYRYEDFYPNMSVAQKKNPTYSATTGWGTGRVQTANIATFNKRFLLWPITSAEDANPNITQNPDW